MPEPFVPDEGKQDNKVEYDAFGNQIGGETPPKDEGKKEEKKFDAIPDDHPTIVALKADIEKVKSEYGGNLSGQRDVIKRLEGEIEALKGGKKDDGKEDDSNLPFKPEDIKFSKDLPKDVLDDMTDNEIKLHDEVMKNRQIMNDMAKRSSTEQKQSETKKVEDRNSFVRSTALELAGGDQNTANQIIESVKMFNLEGLNEGELKARIEQAHKLIPDYKPPREQPTKQGGTVKNGGSDTDPFGTSKIVDEVASKKNGQTFTL